MTASQTKILLINPPLYRLFNLCIPFLQLGLLSIGATLKKNGYAVKVYDVDLVNNSSYDFLKRAAYVDYPFSENLMDRIAEYKASLDDPNYFIWKEIEETIRKEEPDIVGIGFTTDKYRSARNVSGIAKKINKDLIVIAGGPHPTAMPEETIKDSFFDIIVRGEGEDTILELIDALRNGRDLNGVRGITFNQDGRIISTPDRPLIQNIDKLPFPGRELLINEKNVPPIVMGNIITSRGCAYGCSFCASNKIWGRSVRHRSPEAVIEELKHIRINYGTRNFIFWDDTFTAERSRAAKISELIIKNNLKIQWSCQTRVDNIPEELLDKMRLAGLRTLCFGIESGDPGILRKIKKGITVKQIKEICFLVKKKGIKILTSFMIGYSEESEESLNSTIVLLKELNPDYLAAAISIPYPGTEDYNNLTKENRILTYDWYEYIPENHNIVRRLHIDSEKLYKALSGLRNFSLALKKKTMQNNISIRSVIDALKRDIFNPKQLLFDVKKYRMYKRNICKSEG